MKLVELRDRIKGHSNVWQKLIWLNSGNIAAISNAESFIKEVKRAANEIHKEDMAGLDNHLHNLKNKTA